MCGDNYAYCVYVSMFVDKLAQPLIERSPGNRLSMPFSLQLNKNYRINMVVFEMLFTNMTTNVGTEL